jgi:hypothetical protein
MRKPRSAFVLLLLLVFGVSLAVPAEDVPETPYDESETLPYEGTPLFSIVVPQASDRMARAKTSCRPQLRFNSLTKRCRRRPENNARSHRVPVSPTILNHSLRC